ncbi:hypothetical protein PBI_TRISCUIT_59 [Microbacterium phage Triscuit]|nr:hypothetical protein PBI_TRISCUIT_59 [Microbacterium phage Triscuit]
METALTFLIWALFVAVVIITLLVAVHLSALTDNLQARSEAIRADTAANKGLR